MVVPFTKMERKEGRIAFGGKSRVVFCVKYKDKEEVVSCLAGCAVPSNQT